MKLYPVRLDSFIKTARSCNSGPLSFAFPARTILAFLSRFLLFKLPCFGVLASSVGRVQSLAAFGYDD